MRVILLAAWCVVAFTSGVVFMSSIGRAESALDEAPQETFKKAQDALRMKRFQDAVDLATQVIDKKPDFSEAYVLRGLARGQLGAVKEAIADLTQAITKKPTASAHLIRGRFHSDLDRHSEAIADFTETLGLDPSVSEAYHQRGRERFKAGEIEKSIADFDRFIELDPTHENHCWERGLSRYYAGQFAKAQNSFEDYHKVGPEDIENGLWRMVSQAEVEGLAKAQKSLLAYEPKGRPPFPLLYDLYAGTSKPDEVLEHSLDGATNEADRKTRTFYAHLYLGMWFVASKDRPAAMTHLEKAVTLRSADYMWYVARHQLKQLKASDTPKP